MALNLFSPSKNSPPVPAAIPWRWKLDDAWVLGMNGGQNASFEGISSGTGCVADDWCWAIDMPTGVCAPRADWSLIRYALVHYCVKWRASPGINRARKFEMWSCPSEALIGAGSPSHLFRHALVGQMLGHYWATWSWGGSEEQLANWPKPRSGPCLPHSSSAAVVELLR